MSDAGTKFVFCHVLLSYGPKPTGHIENHGPARCQIKTIRYVGRELTDTRVRWTFDHARSINSLASLPSLKTHLEAFRAMGQGVIWVDDLNRVLRACPIKRRAGLMEELAPYGPHIYFVRQQALLEKISPMIIQAIVLNPSSKSWMPGRSSQLSDEEKFEQTQKAVAASRKARSAMADEKARELAQIADELAADGKGRATFAAIAEEANRRGLTTTRGNPWTSASAARAIRRIASRADETHATIEAG